MKYISNDRKEHPNQHKNSHKLCSETPLEFDTIMIRISQWRERHYIANTRIRRYFCCHVNIIVIKENPNKLFYVLALTNEETVIAYCTIICIYKDTISKS